MNAARGGSLRPLVFLLGIGAVFLIWRMQFGAKTTELAITFDLPPGSPYIQQNPRATPLYSVAELPPPPEGQAIKAAGHFEPSGAKFPDGLGVNWTLRQSHAPGTQLSIVVLESGQWKDTGEKATVNPSGNEASGKVFHFSVIGLAGQKQTGDDQKIEPPKKQERKGFDPVAAAKSVGVKPFFSLPNEFANGNTRCLTHLPSKTVIDTLFNDVPFIVNVPFQLPFEGGVARLSYHAAYRFEEPNEDLWDKSIWAKDCGVYRMDGAALPENSVFYDSRGIRSRADWDKAIFVNDVDLPSFTLRQRLSEGGTGPRLYYKKENIPFTEPTSKGPDPTPGASICFAPVQPGAYVFWFALSNLRWPEKKLQLEELKLTLFVDLLVSRGERYTSTDERAYIFQKKPRPEGMADDAQFVALSYEIPVAIRKNAWIFDHAAVRIDDKRLEKKPYKLGSNPAEIETKMAPGPVTKLGFSSIVSTEETKLEKRLARAERLVTDKFEWSVHFPQQIKDYSFETVEIGGSVVRDVNTTHWLINNPKAGDGYTTFSFYDWEPTYYDARQLSWKLSDEEKKWLANDESPGGIANAGYSSETFSAPEDEDREYQRKQFLADFGKEAEKYFFFDQRLRNEERPIQRPGDPPFKFQYFGLPPSEYSRHRIVKNGDPYPLFGYNCGPYVVIGFYRRLKDIALAKTAPPGSGNTVVVKDQDPFFEWFPKYSNLLGQKLSVAGEGLIGARGIQLPLQQLLRSNRRLIDYLQQDGEGGAPKIDPQVRAKVIARANEQAGEINTLRTELERLNAEGVKALQEAITELDAAFDKYGQNHPQILLYKRDVKRYLDKYPYLLAAESGDADTFRAAIAASEALGLGAEARMIEAQFLINEGDLAAALWSLKSAVDVEPNNEDAKRMLLELECAFVKAAMEKSQGEIAAARGAFFKYLEERGYKNNAQEYKPNDVGDIENLPWHKQLNIGLRTMDTESAYAIFSTGLIGSLSGIAGKPFDKARILEATQDELTSAYLGLQAILRLRMKGNTFKEIRTMPVEKLRVALPVKNLGGQPYTAEQATKLAVCIQNAFQLPDMAALVNEDRVALDISLKKSYTPADVEGTWLEWIGDLTSVKNVASILLPFSVARVGGRLATVAFWGAREANIVNKAMAAGKVLSGSEMLAKMILWDRALKLFGSTAAGRIVVARLERIREYQEKLGLLDKGVWTVGKFMAVAMLQGASLHLAEKYGGTKALLVAEAFMLFGADTDLLIKFLGKSPAATKQAANILRKHIVPGIQERINQAYAVKKAARELNELVKQARAGKPLTPQQLAAIEAQFGENWIRQVPNSDPVHDAGMLMNASKQGLENGVDNGAEKGATTLIEQAQKQADEATEKLGQVEQLAAKLEAAQPALKKPEYRGVPEGSRFFRTIRKPGVYEKLNFTYAVHPQPKPGSLSAAAEQLMQAGKYAEALQKYEEAYELVLQKVRNEVEELPVDYLHMKATTAYLAATAKRVDPDPGVIKRLTSKIDRAEAEKLAGQKDLRSLDDLKGNGGEVFEVPGREGEFIVKKIANPDHYPANQAESEAVHAVLAEYLKLPAPAMQIVTKLDDNGEIIQAVIVMRRVNGPEVVKLNEGELFLLRDQLTRHRVLAMLMGDWDRHLKNYRVEGGVLASLDNGLGDPTGLARPQYPPKAPIFMEGEYNRDHWYMRSYKEEMYVPEEVLKAEKVKRRDLLSDAEEFARKQTIVEQSLTYQMAEPVWRELDDLLKPANEEKLTAMLTDAYKSLYGNRPELIQDKVKRTIQTFRTKAERMDEVLRGLNERNAVPLPPKAFWMPQPLRNWNMFTPIEQRKVA